MSFFGKNIKKIRSVKNMSQQAFADVFDLKRGTLGAYEEGRSEPKIDTIVKVANYFSISIGDILTRELTVNELLKFKGDVATLGSEVKIKPFTQIPCITEDNQLEYIMHHDKETFINQMPKLSLPVNDNTVMRGYTISNLEMTYHDKGFYPNDIVVGEQVLLKNLKDVNNGTLVLVLANNKLILRRLYSVGNKIVLRADHVNIEEKSFDKKEIEELWEIKYAFFKRIPEYKDELEQQIMLLSSELSKIKKKIE